MDKILSAFTNMMENGYEAALIIMAILIVRCVLQWIRVPRKYIYLLWMIPFIRLMIPFQVESEFSLMPEKSPAVILEMKETADHYETVGFRDAISYEVIDYGQSLSNSVGTEVAEPNPSPKGILVLLEKLTMPIASLVWLTGIGALFCYSVIAYIRFRIRLSAAMQMDGVENVFLVDELDSPFVLCGRKSLIYLPSHMKEEMKGYVISHEMEHIRRKDPVTKLVAYGICLVQWMNPFVWIAYYFLGKDMELACDEAVICDKDNLYRKEYAKTLLFMSVGKVSLNAVPLAFAEGDPKDRVERISTYKKPAFWAAALGIVCVAGLAVGCLSNPKGEGDITNEKDIAGMKLTAPESYFEGEGEYAKAAKVNLKSSTGIDGSKLYYVDGEKIIFGGYYGVFVFSKEQAKMMASVDLEALGWEDACEVKASKDGKYIYFSPAEDEVDYAYDWKTVTLYQLSKAWDDLEVFDTSLDDGYGVPFMKDGNKIYFQLRESQSAMIGDLMYREYVIDEETGFIIKDKYRHLFLEGRYKNAEAFEPKDLVPIVKAEMVIQGELIAVTDEKILNWLEEHLSKAEEIKGGTGCPFYNPLYITRKDGNVGVIYPATDSCSAFRTENGNYYDYTPGYEDNSEFWSYFEGWLEGMYPDIYGRVSEEKRTEALGEDAEYVDGAWLFRGKSYRYRLEITGRWSSAAKDVTYVIVTNDKDITFGELFPLSGLSSNMDEAYELGKTTALIRIEVEE